MTPDETDSPQGPDEPARTDRPPSSEESNDLETAPFSEDAGTPDPSSEETVAEDDPDLLDPSTRSLEAAEADDAEDVAEAPPAAAEAVETDEAGDATRVSDELATGTEPERPLAEARLDHDVVAHRIAVQLKRVEVEVRDLLEGRDSKRKRKLSGTRRWHELEEDIIEWLHTDRFDEASLTRLQELVARRNHLFRSLRFVTGTRPRWNT